MDFLIVTATAGSKGEAERFYRHIRRKVKGLYRDKSGFGLRYNSEEGIARVIFEGDETSYGFAKRSIATREKVSHALAEYVIEEKEVDIIKRLISKEYDVADTIKRTSIENTCIRLLSSEEEGSENRQRRVKQLASQFRNFIEEYAIIHVEGFLSFRMKEYLDKIRETIDFAVEEYILDKQYEEFITLLQYFVHFQETQIPIVHLMHKGGGEFTIIDDMGTPIDASRVEGVIARMTDHDLELEDVIVSSLITLSPKKIVIHTRDPDIQMISTIRQIFGDKIEMCGYCPECRLYLNGERNHGHHQ
ncbi:putative sporulation protein YtxC [Paenibacillus shirakamiensis]|uniref:Sporulation protein YtxC n=1 Tax=Paenibacillus shirakamiensis TaxID=1265935 RepID=A0ABS4JKE5_9BACL|nr:putative sporulation protein YtxC [Paenibacillus shirakamiensis]MBP2002183.1 putative sporulation protein YtxC [Paenibacillus shirakamiensis]